MKIRETFLIRCLVSIDKNKEERAVFDVEHIQTGEKWSASTIDETNELIKKTISAAAADEQNKDD